jgi:hypothetical protein
MSGKLNVGIRSDKGRTSMWVNKRKYCKFSGTYDLPPSSRVTGVKCFEAAAITILPTAPLPV